VFLVIWAIIWYIPIPPAKFRFTSKRRILSLAIGLILFGFNALAFTPLSLFVYYLIISRSFVAVIEYLFLTSNRLRIERFNQTYHVTTNTEFQARPKRKDAIVVFGLIFVFVGSIFGTAVYGEVQRVTNATYFNSFIEQSSDSPFNQTIPDGMGRLVTKELAISIARRHMSEFGSNTQILDCHITKSPEGNLVWVATIASTNVIAENYIKGFILVDATEPTSTPKIVVSEFDIGQGLWWDRNIPFRNYVDDLSKTYGVSYPTWDLDTNSLVYVVTRYELGFDFVKRYETPLVYNAKGDLLYSPSSLSSIPSWITQVYDEDWMENMIGEMGDFRKGSGFDYFAGGFLWFVGPSRDRFQMTEDTRYIVDPVTTDVVGLVCVNPFENSRSLSGVFKATREGVLFYDFKSSNYISGMTAEDLVEGRLPKPATGNYYAIMPLLYGVETTPGNFNLAWYVPIYWYEESGEFDETVYLAGFAIVDAQDTNKIALTINQEGITSEQLVKQTRIQYIQLFGVAVEDNPDISATVVNRYDYVQDGSTHVVLRLNSAEYPWIEATAGDLSATQWNELISTQPNHVITAKIEKHQDRWMITEFENNNIQ
jgi:hypothetical protein